MSWRLVMIVLLIIYAHEFQQLLFFRVVSPKQHFATGYRPLSLIGGDVKQRPLRAKQQQSVRPRPNSLQRTRK
ncbi:hypothetical protein B0T19DRAFT_212823 [Cercophora scortea]|uniref:Secreted protein n=1 Tax=Cercophora scortea TaxID=314031 RepID=A0AAE0IEV2_9PEZI|nr:hypothetical protein B0T19DRAFT_212823 [Cercophora scortea]